MTPLEEKIANALKASEDLENEARKMSVDSKAELRLYDSRLYRDRIEEVSIRILRAERYVLSVGIVHEPVPVNK